MKRKGFIYDRMADWDLIKEAERIAVKNKAQNRGVKLHRDKWLANLVEIQGMVVNRKMCTGEYKHEQRISGQGKLRDIAKLYFHPSHIQHQLLVMAAYEEIDKTFIRHTYASRIGYGQHRGALQMNEWIQKYHNRYKWYFQFDITKYYDSIPHDILRQELSHTLKDEEFINAFLEPIEKFSPDGKSIPLGIRPSQTFGNLALRGYDRMIKEEQKVHCYVRYLDDSAGLCETKADCWRVYNAANKWCKEHGFKLHPPKIAPLTEGLDFLGFKMYPKRGMFWRTSDKKAWLKRRKGITNKRRLREIDGSAWGYIKHGNSHCRKLYKKMAGISFEKTGLRRPEHTDSNGCRFIERPKIGMEALLNRQITIYDFVEGFHTQHGDDRYAIELEFCGMMYKLITNSSAIKAHLQLMRKNHVTKHTLTFFDKGRKFYDILPESIMILEIDNRAIDLDKNGNPVFLDNMEPVTFEQ